MKIVYLHEEKEQPIKAPKKPTKKEKYLELADAWILKQHIANEKKAMKMFSKEIEEIRKINPNFLK
jgi:hypothetical protein